MATISQVIKSLEEAKKKHGDLEVVFDGPAGLSFENVIRKVYIEGRMEEELFIGSPYLGITKLEKVLDRYQTK